MGAQTIPVIIARGTHREVGRQIGEQCRAYIQQMFDLLRKHVPAGASWADLLKQSEQYLAPSRAVYPQYVEELEGIAEGSGVPFTEIFASMCEELWESTDWVRGCTDMAARGRATRDGATLIAHTNDLKPETQDDLVILKIQAGDEPEWLGVSVGGVGVSAGFNAAGISLTGNQLDSNDVHPGVPRLLVVRAILGAKHLGEAITHCLLPQRASSYNNVIADAHGEVYSMEGSGTDLEAIYIEEDLLAHANHYVAPAMRRFEADRNVNATSIIRHNRAWRLLREHKGELTVELFKKLLADHAGYPVSICKHGMQSVTVFSIIIHVEALTAWIGLGKACEAEYVEYKLEPYQTGH